MSRRWAIALGTMAATALVASVPAMPATPPGLQHTSILIGGNFAPETPGIYSSLIDAAGGTGSRICVFDVAASSPGAGRTYVADLRRLGVARVRRVPVHGPDARAEARSAANAALVRSCDGHMLSGGNQLRAMRALSPGGAASPVLAALRRSAEQGAAVAGSSAGLHVQSDPMIGGGEPRDALTHGPTWRHRARGVRLAAGFGTFDHLADSHFDERGRLGRLLIALGGAGGTLAFGVDEDTALVSEDGMARVFGSGGVTVLEAAGGETFFSYLRAGDSISLKGGEVTPGAGRETVSAGNRSESPPRRRLVAPGIARRLAGDLLARSEAIATMASGPSSTVEVRLTGGSYAASDGPGPPTIEGARLELSRVEDD